MEDRCTVCIISLFDGGRMLVTFQDTNWKFEAFGYRGGGDVPIIEPEGVQSITAPFHIYSKTSHCNLFVPPAFYLHSGFRFDPKVIMERMQGPHPLGDVQATVIVWSAYSTSRAQAGVFTSAFTRVAQEFEGSASHYEMLQEIRWAIISHKLIVDILKALQSKGWRSYGRRRRPSTSSNMDSL
ncbi:hypothetical protein B0J17DRAFT_659018 [Rhizoctonia solani]|nr:hypothetical protein B0J17DRAFT_659018 [Rhizoctonia solani]